MHGSFDNDNPFIEIRVAGATGTPKTIKAMLDTGFNGYLTLPFTEAFPLGLILSGTQSSRIADGSISHSLVCLGNVTLDNRQGMVTIQIQENCGILIGTRLLKKFGKRVSIDFVNETIEIVDSSPASQLG